jgi:Na+:H+ antiporter, NhaA family
VSSTKNQRPSDPNVRSPPPGAWRAAHAVARRLLSPVERFLAIEASSGILLLVAAAAALAWANSPWHAQYEALWHTPVGLHLGAFHFERDLHFVINDGLMVVFFFVVGLEIRRELDCGELSEPRRAALPAIAALGGMLAPACLYLAFNAGTSAVAGWGVPMATDIAFAVGILALLGKRVRPALRILLLALAVIDDLGAIIVIALFYSAGIRVDGLAVVAGGIGLLLLFQKLGVRPPVAYLLPGLVIWAGTYMTGVHPTLAGVVVGLLTPVRAWLGRGELLDVAQAAGAAAAEPQGERSQEMLRTRLTELELARRESVSPVERLLHTLHPWVAFVIMPVFAFANAGVAVGDASIAGAGATVLVGVMAGLVVGKPVGILLLSWAAVRLRIAALPAGIAWREILVVGLVAGIGFTMALFIAGLAFPAGALLEVAKLGILCASALAAVIGLAAGRWLLSPTAPPLAAPDEASAEASTST